MANKFNHKRYLRSSQIERSTYFYSTSQHCGVNIRYAPVVETPSAYERRMRNKERTEAWLQFVRSRKCIKCYETCKDKEQCLNRFNKVFIPRYKYREVDIK